MLFRSGRARRLDLAVRHGIDAGAKHLAVIGAVVQHEGNGDAGEATELQAHERQAREQQHQQDQRREGPEEVPGQG